MTRKVPAPEEELDIDGADPGGARRPPRMTPVLEWTYRLIQRYRPWIAVAAYAGVTAAAYLGAFLLRFEFAIPPAQSRVFLLTLPALLAVRLGAIRFFGLSTGRWRFVGTDDVVRLTGATLAGSVVFWILVAFVPILPRPPRSVLFLEGVLTLVGTAGLWVTYRVSYERLRRRSFDQAADPTRVLIVGAGEAGNLLARELIRFPTGYRLIGFVDDDPFRWGNTMHGVEVVGATKDLSSIVAAVGAEEIIIAVPSATPEQIRRIVEHCEAVDVPFKVLPGIAEVLAGDVQLRQLRSLEIDDLLGREPVSLELPELRRAIEGQRVLVTGGAGSIGSELCRQIAAHAPGHLIVLDQAESDLFFVELELRKAFPRLRMDCVVGDILDPVNLGRVFREFRPEQVFHAAAYKHVPLMESNVREAVRNNVIGTWRVSRAAAEHECRTFVLISTDKAVHPHSVMGATKRAAEKVVMACGEIYPDTSFVAVRFGNVLGSKGSVVPIFRNQLERGEPLTVTHPDVTRYFMTISEAVQLVLQASTLQAAKGQIAMLEMGEPVKIVDLARNMIRLSGLREGHDVMIEFTGLRPGEKLHEMLAGDGERTSPTLVDRVLLVEGSDRGAGGDEFIALLDELETLVDSGAEGEQVGARLRDFLELQEIPVP